MHCASSAALDSGGKRTACVHWTSSAASLERGPGVVGDDRDAGGEVRGERLARLRARHATTARTPGIFRRAARRTMRVRRRSTGNARPRRCAPPGMRHIDAVPRATGDDFRRVDDARAACR